MAHSHYHDIIVFDLIRLLESSSYDAHDQFQTQSVRGKKLNFYSY
jgi:hypothetical protein